VRIWIGPSHVGQPGAAPMTLNMLPKFELAPIRMYLRMLTKPCGPPAPLLQHHQTLSNRITSADSLAMSTALSTERPTSARAGRGVIDAVAHEPTTWPLRCMA